MEPGTPTYNIAEALRLKGLLNLAALEKSIQEIVRRHETLRTTFATAAGQPTQVIAPILTLTLLIVDLRELSKAEREAEVLRLANDEAHQAFDLLLQGPLLRVKLLQLDEAEHVILFTMHHIVSDGWSMGVFMRELSVPDGVTSKLKA